jgi:predicted tellurium resistance membrane protein TerC
MDWISDPQAWVAFATLLLLETVLGIDNVIFISILASKLPANQQANARRIGLAVALLSRLMLLLSLSWIMRLTQPLFTVFNQEISGRDLILICGGLFLLAKSTREIHERLEGQETSATASAPSFASVILQVLILDVVFSLDSVITAVGMVDDIGIMVAAVIAAVLFMMMFAGAISAFVEEHPTIKILALSFLLLIGVTLVAEGLDQHIPKGYIYFSMAFSVLVEMLNIRARKGKSDPVRLHSGAPTAIPTDGSVTTPQA